MRSGSGIAVALFLGLMISGVPAHSQDDELMYLKTADGYVPCWRESQNFIMRDNGFCANPSHDRSRDKAFCMTPIRCYPWGYDKTPTVGMVTCRAHWTAPIAEEPKPGLDSKSPGDGHLTCPSLQACADDDHQQLVTEQELKDEPIHILDDVIPADAPASKPAPPESTH